MHVLCHYPHERPKVSLPGALFIPGSVMQIAVRHNVDRVSRQFSNKLTVQIPWVTVQALNDTALEGLEAVQDEMRARFDRPVNFTLNAFMVWRADKRTMMAMVKERPSVGRRHYLKVQGSGGPRPNTGLEKLVQSRLRYAGNITAITPASGAKLDASGNWSTGQRNRVLSAVQSQRDSTANTTAASRKRNRKRAQYFVPRPGSKLSPGIWERDGKTIRKIVHFTQAVPTYRQSIDWRETVQRRTASAFARHFRARLAAIRD